MSKTDVGITVSKEEDFSEWYTQVVLKAKLADYAPVKGLIVLRPDGYSIWESLRSTFDKKFAKNGIKNEIGGIQITGKNVIRAFKRDGTTAAAAGGDLL